MGIDIGFAEADTEAEAAEEMERVCSVKGFFSMAEALSKLLDTMDENNVPYDFETPELEPVVQAYKAFVSEDPEIFDARFKDYCEFIREAHKVHKEQHATDTDLLSGQPLVDPDPDEFRPDVRVFLGRALLVGEPVTPAVAEELLPPLMFPRAVISQFTAHFREGNPELAHHLEDVQEMLATLTNHYLAAIEEGKTVVISY